MIKHRKNPFFSVYANKKEQISRMFFLFKNCNFSFRDPIGSRKGSFGRSEFEPSWCQISGQDLVPQKNENFLEKGEIIKFFLFNFFFVYTFFIEIYFKYCKCSSSAENIRSDYFNKYSYNWLPSFESCIHYIF